MKVFGPAPRGFAVDAFEMMTDTPVGAVCDWCGEPIAEGEAGTIMPILCESGAQCVHHRECHGRLIFGSVGHQEGRCSCNGGDAEDPPGMTKREAAREALALFLATRRFW